MAWGAKGFKRAPKKAKKAPKKKSNVMSKFKAY